MRVLEVYRSFDPSLGGVERHITDLCYCLARRGHIAVILYWVAGLQSNENLPVLKHHIPMPELVNKLRYLKMLYLATMIITTTRRYNIDLIHAHDYSCLIASMLASRICRIPVVATFHLPPQREINRWMNSPFRLLEKFLLEFAKRKVSRGICVSKYTFDRILELGFTPVNFRVIHNWVSLTFARAQPTVDVPIPVQKNTYLLSVGRLEMGHKGSMILIDAFRKTSKRIADLKLVMVGTGPHADVIKAYVGSKGLDDKILFLKGLDDRTLSVLYENCLAFVLASTIEGLPLAILEAMRHGRPVIATNVGGIPEVINDQKNGLLVPANSSAIADAIMKILSDHDLAERLGHEGAEEVYRRFSQANCELAASFLEKCAI